MWSTPKETNLTSQTDGQDENNKEDFEKRFQDTQAAYTKARQNEINMAKLLVENDPANIERISDEVVQKKILREKYWVDTLEELKIIHPDYNKKPEQEDDDWLTQVEKLEREVKLMKFQNTKTKTNEAIEGIKEQYKDVVATIPDFEQKLSSELKSVSEQLTPKERVEKAFKLVASSDINSANAYSVMQWVSTGAATKSKKESKEKSNETIANILKNNNYF